MVTPLGRVTGWTSEEGAGGRAPVARRAPWVFAFLWCLCWSAAAPTAKVPEYKPAARRKPRRSIVDSPSSDSPDGASGGSASPDTARLSRPPPAVNWTVGDRIASTPMSHLVAAPDKFRGTATAAEV